MQSNQSIPTWLGQPEFPPTAFATLNLPIVAPDANASLLVTLYFTEKDGGFLRIIWQGTQASRVLSDNFYEGIGMSNQRSLLISPDTLAGGGKLCFQCGAADLGVQRIKLQWLENKAALGSSAEQDLLVTPDSAPTEPVQNFDGQTRPEGTGAWKGQFVSVPIAGVAQRIEQGVEFSVQLDSIPTSGRVVLEEAGLPMGKHLVVWINQQRAGTVTPTVPDLSDTGFLAQNSPDNYVGWRNGSFYVSAALLKTGPNTVQFSVEDEVASNHSSPANPAAAPAPLAIKNATFQLNYPAPATLNPVAPVSPSSTNAETTEANPPTGPTSSTPPSISSETDMLLPGPGEMRL